MTAVGDDFVGTAEIGPVVDADRGADHQVGLLQLHFGKGVTGRGIGTEDDLRQAIDLGMGFVAIAFGVIMLIRYKSKVDTFYKALDWDLLLFFIFLFNIHFCQTTGFGPFMCNCQCKVRM